MFVKAYDLTVLILNNTKYYSLDYLKEDIKKLNYYLLLLNVDKTVCERLDNAQTKEILIKDLQSIKRFLLKQIRKQTN